MTMEQLMVQYWQPKTVANAALDTGFTTWIRNLLAIQDLHVTKYGHIANFLIFMEEINATKCVFCGGKGK